MEVMETIFIRHFQTPGNEKRQYIGSTEEELSCRAREEFAKNPFFYPRIEMLIASPMKRCIQTAELLYPGREIVTETLLRECDFGAFEKKTYEELKEHPAYIRWLHSGGEIPFPGGEGKEAFRERCVQGFQKTIEKALAEGKKSAAFVVHGGTMMSVLSAYDVSCREFYTWQAANGEGYQAVLDIERFRAGERCFTEILPLTKRYRKEH